MLLNKKIGGNGSLIDERGNLFQFKFSKKKFTKFDKQPFSEILTLF